MALSNIVIVLYQPQDVRNIGAVVRAMKNTGLNRLRLVHPVPFDPADIGGIAHRSEDVLAQLGVFATLDAALADCTHIVGSTARARAEHPARADVRILAAELRARASVGTVALLFGSEGNGLDNAALDRCHELVTLPINPGYNSLNLAQAALLLCYEIWMAAPPAPADAQPQLPAAAGQLETLFEASEQALHTIEFFKGSPVPTMRLLRQLAHRAALAPNEAALLAAIAREVQRFVERVRGMG
ncbi:MAG: rRNA methyltransferase [Roseiflexaceae bacterium]|nr:rRNA methyltransferase [Roseiflexaceae bacterium]